MRQAAPSLVQGPKETAELAKGIARIGDRHAQLRRTLTQAGQQHLLEQFTRELDRLLDDQVQVSALFAHSPAWARRTLNRQFFAIRSAAEILRLSNLAALAGRAEVLLGLMEIGKVALSQRHIEALKETRELLREAAEFIREDGNDKRALLGVQTATCIYSVVEPLSLTYVPAPNPNNGQ
jgi:hypothetical protein